MQYYCQGNEQSTLGDMNFLSEYLSVLSVNDFGKLPLIKNRRFMYHDGTLILGEEDYLWGKGNLRMSHAEEFFESGVRGDFDSFCRGWIGYSKDYPDGIIHFAPMVTSKFEPHLDAAIDFMQMFKASCRHDRTIVRGFILFAEQRLNELKL